MKINRVKRIILFGVVVCIAMLSTAQTVSDSVVIYFRINEVKLDLDYGSNRASLDRIKNILNQNYNDSASWNLRKVVVTGEASPEGPVRMNRNLAKQRAESLFNYITTLCAVPDSLKTMQIVDSDWESLLRMAEADPNLPMRQQTLESIRTIIIQASKSESLRNQSILQLKKLGGGAPYKYICTHFLPLQRKSMIHLYYNKISQPVVEVTLPVVVDSVDVTPVVNVADTVLVEEPTVEPTELPVEGGLYWAVKSNLLYDALLVPNVGAEFYLGNNWSVAANGMFAWWKKGVDRRWCVYGADMAVRRWFGRKADAKPLTGHHVGVYAQALTYDFCLDDKGYMGGEPEGSILDKMNYAFGLEYGYSLPIARRLNLDFVLGLGYWGGTYHEYRVIDDCKVWQASKNRHWFGPTKAEVSLVWLLGSSKSNKEGGTR